MTAISKFDVTLHPRGHAGTIAAKSNTDLLQDMVPTEDLETDESGRPSVSTSNVMAREESEPEYQAFRAGATDWLVTAMNDRDIEASR